MLLTSKDLSAIVGAIRSEMEPAAIILFGSYARGEETPASDLDLLVIRNREFQAGESRRSELGRLYRAVSKSCSISKDILLFTRAEYQDWKDTTNHMLAVAAHEGRILYGKV